MMRNIKLVALDLDGTLLNSDKKITTDSRKMLYRAAEQGVEIVPTTGRFFGGMPEEVRKFPYLHYAITVNGAQVYDICNDKVIYSAEIPCEKAVEILDFLDQMPLPLIYDSYINNWGWMTRSMQDDVERFAPDAHYLKALRTLRTPVDSLRDFIMDGRKNPQKIQLYMRMQDLDHKEEWIRKISEEFEWLSVTTSVVNNIELNVKAANKGEALMALANYLNIPEEKVAAFGDGSNDLSMIRTAGFGVSMGNAIPELKEEADYVSENNDHEGIAFGFRKFLK